jgi:hypothetical protein
MAVAVTKTTLHRGTSLKSTLVRNHKTLLKDVKGDLD